MRRGGGVMENRLARAIGKNNLRVSSRVNTVLTRPRGLKHAWEKTQVVQTRHTHTHREKCPSVPENYSMTVVLTASRPSHVPQHWLLVSSQLLWLDNILERATEAMTNGTS